MISSPVPCGGTRSLIFNGFRPVSPDLRWRDALGGEWGDSFSGRLRHDFSFAVIFAWTRGRILASIALSG